MGLANIWSLSRLWSTRTSRRRRLTLALISVGLTLFLLISRMFVRQHRPTPAVLEEIYDPAIPSNSLNTTILLVSAMFPLSKSKHSHDEYSYWLTEFLRPITTDVYFFTAPDFASTVRNARGGNLPITIDTTYSSAFEIPPLKGLEDKYEEMHHLDREKFRHSPDLYAIWNAKPFFLDTAVRNLEKRGNLYDYAFWNDAGSFRGGHRYTEWPDPRRIEQVWEKGEVLTGRSKEDLLFFPFCGIYDKSVKTWTEKMGPVDNEVSEGSFFGGSPSAISWWSQTFYAYHDHYLSLGLFVGKDQTLINAILLLFPERIITLWYTDPSALAREGRGIFPFNLFEVGYLGACGSDWFYYQFWLAQRGPRDQMREIWLDWMRWKDWEWLREDERCRLTGVLALKNVLERRFGQKWIPPVRTL